MTTSPRNQIDDMSAAEFFGLFSSLLKANPPTAQDAPMVEILNRFGLLDGFDATALSCDVTKGLSGVPEAAHQQILGHYARQKQANGWIISTGSGHYGTDYLQRALVAYIGVGGNLPADAFYPIARFDADGKVLSGANRYTWRFTPTDAPIDPRGFWSLTVLRQRIFLAPNSIDRQSFSSQDTLQQNADGSTDVYIQQESPGPDKQANWLPAPGGDFILMLRLYWPKESTRTPPPAHRVE